MTREEKVKIIEECVAIFSTPGVYLMDFKGLNVEQITELRVQLRQAKVSMVVVKNTLAKRALKEVGISSLDPYLVGPTGVVYSEEDSVTPARLLVEFIKKNKKGTIKAGIMDGGLVTADQMDEVSKLPTKKELYGMLASTLNAPIVKLARTLNALPVKLVRTVDAVKTKQEGGES